MNQQCETCRFWKLQSTDGDCPVDGPGYGWCRRFPPVISDHMAAIAIGTIPFGGKHSDPQDLADVSRVHEATLYPATWRDQWCGEFAAIDQEKA